jgi:hypothetical protein
MGESMKHFIAVGVLVILALVVRFGLFERFGLDISIHDTYWVIPLRAIGFWTLVGIAVVWFAIAAHKFGRHSS